MLADCFAPVCTLVGKTWTLHLEKVVRVSREENLAMIADSVAFLVGAGQARHLRRRALLRRLARRPRRTRWTACAPPPTRAPSASSLCDTNGSSLPSADRRAPSATSSRRCPDVALGIHCHNDAECGVANTLAAVEAGATQVQGTMNGVGERTGNANLVSIIANLQLKLGHRVRHRRAAAPA